MFKIPEIVKVKARGISFVRLPNALPVAHHTLQIILNLKKYPVFGNTNQLLRLYRPVLMALMFLSFDYERTSAALPPGITVTAQPTNQTVTVGQTACFTVLATGDLLTYQWRKNGSNISGATGATLSLGLARPDQIGTYTVVIANSLTSLTSSPPATLQILPAQSGSVVAWGYADAAIAVPLEAFSNIVEVACGFYDSVALKYDGSVIAWGDDVSGRQVIPAEAQTNIMHIASGTRRIVALTRAGTVISWSPNSQALNSVPDLAQSNVVAVTAGYGSVFALKDDGSVIGWGDNSYGQTAVPEVARSQVSSIAAGERFSVVLKRDGSVVSWGQGPSVPASAREGVVAIAATRDGVIAQKFDGSVIAWSSPAPPTSTKAGVVAIAAGDDAECLALKGDGTVVVWGGGYLQTTTPKAKLLEVQKIAAGGSHALAVIVATAPKITNQIMNQTVQSGQFVTFAVAATGNLLTYQWRRDGTNIIGATNVIYSINIVGPDYAGAYSVVVSNSGGSVTSAPPAILTVISAVVRNSGVAIAWGDNTFGQTLLSEEARTGITGIAAGRAHIVALSTNGVVTAWGDNSYGQTAIPALVQGKVISLAAGAMHTAALLKDGSVVAWGDNSSGQVSIPGSGANGITSIAAGSAQTVALSTNGSVTVWGNNDSGQTTIPIAAQAGVVGITSGGYHVLALTDKGSVVAWGDSRYGQTTVPAAAQSGVVAIAAGFGHSVALRTNGLVVAWGWNDSGQSTVPVAALSNVTQIAAGYAHTLALKNDGTLIAWGYNGYGQTTVPDAARTGIIAIAGGNANTVVIIDPSMAAAVLNSSLNRGSIIISWPSYTTGFTLQSANQLSQPIWSDSSNQPVTLNGQFVVTNAIPERMQFYRLKK